MNKRGIAIVDFKRLYYSRRAAGDSLRRAEDARRITGTSPSLALSKYTGSYEDPLLGRFAITESGGKLRIAAGPHHAGELEHWQYDTFRIHYDKRWQGADQISFTIGNGVPSVLNIAGFSLSRVSGGGASATH